MDEYAYSVLAHPDDQVWELIFESLPDMVALIDIDNQVLKANQAMREMLNVGDRAIFGHNCFDLMHGTTCPVDGCPHKKMLQDEKTHTLELYEPTLTKYLHITTTPIFNSDGKILGSIHIARDISLQKESEAKLQQFNAELEELSRNKDKFFSFVAHDLRSPFQGMLGFTDMILENFEELTTTEVISYLKQIRIATANTFTLLENLLAWSRIQSGRMIFNPSVFSMSEEISRIFDLFTPNAIQKNIELLNLVDPVLKVNADRQMIQSVLLNLVSNAIKFSNPYSKVKVVATPVDYMNDVFANETAQQYAQFMKFTVVDSGIGISNKMREEIMSNENHHSHLGTHNESGAGLGLMIAKEVVEKHEGVFDIKSEEGKGSYVSFTLPVVT